MNNKDYLQKFRRRMYANRVCNVSERETNEARENFNEMVDNMLVPSVHKVPYVHRSNVGVSVKDEEINVLVEDTSKNDQKTNDEKNFSFKWDMDVNSGDMIFWDNIWWVMYHQERKAVQSHKQFVAKKCNFTYKFINKGEEFIIPMLITNLTLYSDGLADKVYMSNEEGKRRLSFTNNEHTKVITTGTKIMVSDRVFEITHIDDFSRPGVKDCILSQIFRNSLDDIENNLAFNEISKPDETGIIGSNIIYLGSDDIYETDVEGLLYTWSVESTDECVVVDTKYDNSIEENKKKCRITCDDNIDCIGTKAILKLEVRSSGGTSTTYTKEIIVKGMF